MKALLIIIIISFSGNLFGQIRSITFDDCKNVKYLENADNKPIWKDKLKISQYFNKYFKRYSIHLQKETNGSVYLGIIIFKNGNTCCHTFLNLTNINLDSEVFKMAVNKMPKWKPARQNGKRITYLISQIIRIDNGIFTDELTLQN
jgi:hypothetical protein